MNTQIVKLSEIDAEIIPLIRKVDIESESYKGLNFSIQKDSQKNPIIIRELTDEEKVNARENTIYGIIDGHHRYSIAKNNNADTIFAQIETRNPEDNNNYFDTVLAYRLNESSIKMSSLEKGKVIYTLAEQENKEISEIGKEIFNLAKAMSYRIVNDYKKSIGVATTRKPRDNKFNGQILKEAFEKLPKDAENLDFSESEYEEKLQAVKTAQLQLKHLKSLLEKHLNKK